jgi:biopolymer transport protein ExbD
VGVDVKELFGKGMPEFPDLPLAVGGTWTNEIEMPTRRLGTMKMKVVNKLLSVDHGKATVAQTQQVDGDGVALPGGGKLTMELVLSEGTSVIDLATGRPLEVTNDVVLKSDAGAAGMVMSTSVRLRAIDAPRAKEAQPAPVELPESTQGKAAVLEDVVLTVRHTPGNEVECADFAAGRDCAAAEHWRAAFTAFDGEPLAMVNADKVDQVVLGNVLLDTAAVRRRLPGGQSRSEAQLVVRAPRGTPFGPVRRILEEVVTAGITRIAFAAQSPGARARIVSVPLEVPEPAAQPEAIEEVRVALLLDQTKLIRQFGRTVMSDGEAGERQLQGILVQCLTSWSKLGKPDVAGVIDASKPVRWQEIIHLHDQMRAAGFETVQFAGLNTVK